ncbi:MAG: ParB/RepB/Spo0J family partition protein [Alphaproteobacteria bacterium]
MTEEKRTRGLGRGLSALLGEQDREAHPADRPQGAQDVPIEYLEPNPFQPRRAFREEELETLTASVREKGVLQPIIVRPVAGKTNAFQIIAGERRWRAAQKARRHTVPVIVRELTDAEALEVALIENVQRTDLNPIEEAAGYQALIGEFGYTQEQLSKVIGKSRSHLANMLRLLSLPAPVQDMVKEGTLSAGHARAILTAADPETLAKRVVAKGLSVRETESLAREGRDRDVARAVRDLAERQGGPVADQKDPDTRALERDLSDAIGLKVSIEHKGDKGGEVRIGYATLEQLDEIVRRLRELPSVAAE